MKGYVHSLESFGSVDGPGVRYVIFLSGCAMRCQFCHNPDTWKMGQGQEYTADELLSKALRYKVYWGNKGGITVSGGEPLLQIDFLTELFRKAKAAGIHTTLDTSANPFTDKEPWHSRWLELMKYTDLVLLDIKQIDEAEHIRLTGHSNKNILAMARELSDMKKPVWIRHVLVRGAVTRMNIFTGWQILFIRCPMWSVWRCCRIIRLENLSGRIWGLIIHWRGLILLHRNGLIMPGRFLELFK